MDGRKKLCIKMMLKKKGISQTKLINEIAKTGYKVYPEHVSSYLNGKETGIKIEKAIFDVLGIDEKMFE